VGFGLAAAVHVGGMKLAGSREPGAVPLGALEGPAPRERESSGAS
jgi:hypothetical protein